MQRLPLLGFIRTSEERHYAKSESRKAPAMYHTVRAQYPELIETKLYAKIVVSLTGADAAATRALVRAAEQSLAEWPRDRGLTFRDVVHYLCFSRGLTATVDGRAHRCARSLNSVIPNDL